MGAPDLLQWFRRDGFALSLLPSGGLAVRPASKLTDAHRQALRDHKAEIVDALNSPAPVHDFDREAFEERAAIMEHDGGMGRADAEAAAAVICGEVPDPDRHCWPHTKAMNTAEIDTFMARLHLFTERGLDGTEAERLADCLVVRDREADGRGMCLECLHLRRGAGLWMCNQWQRAGQSGADVPGDQVKLLQRCDGFKEATR
jgi:hypothetical protein